MRKTRYVESPSDFVTYSTYDERLPDLRPRVSQNLWELTHIIQEESPKIHTVNEVLSLPYGSSWGLNNSEMGVQLYVYGTFRNKFKLISSFADMLADFYTESQFIPIIVPISSVEWRRTIYHQRKVRRRLTKQAIINYLQENDEN